ncbi:ABC transporter substrate-binding protein [Nocardioides sp. GY 10127]|uniref:ABC transporter substrate-binding protein n=1 Tax=Nocardioides sp. GY 10127 TaxID=2569762 RepID=UPI0010A910A2|nr:ABC transporter substrate-binding protein [Nocardioides sp. GY 10127]TIC80025.1 ABC transporter substrate-binding protein [Nocardioides sp. GY 10127]
MRNYRSLHRVIAVALATVLAVVLAACSGGSSSSSATSDIFKLGTTEQASSLNPLMAGNGFDLMLWRTIYPQLVTYDENLEPAPALAQSWTWSKDKKTLTFELADGATWSDGEALTAEDAAWTIKTLLKYSDGATATAASYIAGVSGAKALSDTELEVDFSSPQADALGNMAYSFFILPEHVYKKYATGDGSKLLSFTNQDDTVTAGPFDLESWSTDFVLTSANPDYWGTGPKIAGYGVQYYSSDDSLTSALTAGDIDGVRIPSANVIEAAEDDSNLVVNTTASLGYYTIEVNVSDNKKAHRELLDPKVREAMDMAIDRKTILEQAFLGYGSTGVGPVTSASNYTDTSLTGTTFDIDAANKILDDAGYTMGSDGIRMADGHEMSYEFNFPSTMRGPGDRAFAILKKDWAKIGIEVTAKYIDSAANFADIFGTNNTYDTFDLGFWDWIALPPEPGFILSVQTCAALGGYNDTGYCNKKYDALFAKQATTTNAAARQKILDQMQQMIYDERGLMVMTEAPATDIHAQGWDGIVLTGLQAYELPNTWLSIHKTDS